MMHILLSIDHFFPIVLISKLIDTINNKFMNHFFKSHNFNPSVNYLVKKNKGSYQKHY
jgi:hypothetical protein